MTPPSFAAMPVFVCYTFCPQLCHHPLCGPSTAQSDGLCGWCSTGGDAARSNVSGNRPLPGCGCRQTWHAEYVACPRAGTALPLSNCWDRIRSSVGHNTQRVYAYSESCLLCSVHGSLQSVDPMPASCWAELYVLRRQSASLLWAWQGTCTTASTSSRPAPSSGAVWASAWASPPTTLRWPSLPGTAQYHSA